MSPFKDDDLNERLDAAAKAKQAMLEKFRAKQRPAERLRPVLRMRPPRSPSRQPDGGGRGRRRPGKAGK